MYRHSMVKQPKKPRGRPALGDEAMQQIAIRLSAELLAEVDAINEARRGSGGRTAVIRELLWEAIDKRKGTRK
jgi:metal-responsive CopG/Arc/MetJ family transcriptional regulator